MFFRSVKGKYGQNRQEKHKIKLAQLQVCLQGRLARNFGLKTGLEEVRRSILPIKTDVLMLFSFCKRQIWLESARETQNQTCLASGMPSRPSSPKFWAENRARRGLYAYFGDKYGYYDAFSSFKRLIWLELAWETLWYSQFRSYIYRWASGQIFRAQNRAKIGLQVCYGDKNGYSNAFLVL